MSINQHHFEIFIANQYGVNVAIFLDNIAYWLHKNVANNNNYREDKYWTYSTQSGLQNTFTYWTRQNIRTIINKCVKENLIIIKKFNKNKYDQTHWYSLTEKGLDLYPRLKSLILSNGENQPMRGLEPTIEKVETNQPIPNTKTNTKTYLKECVAQKPESEKPKNDPPKHKTLCPLDLKPNENHYELAKKLGVNADEEIAHLIDWSHSKGEKRLDWDRTFNNWIRNEAKFTKSRGQSYGKPRQKVEPMHEACRETLEQIKSARENKPLLETYKLFNSSRD